MTGGYFARHLARMRLTYKKRMEHLTAALTDALGPALTIRGRHSGAAPAADDARRRRRGADDRPRRGGPGALRLHGLSGYYLARPELCPPDTVVAGYAALPDSDIDAAAAALARAWRG